MRASSRAGLITLPAVLVLAGCGFGGYTNTYSGTVTPSSVSGGGGIGAPGTPATGFPPGASGAPGGSLDTVVFTPSIEGTLIAAVGTSATVTVTFASSDDAPMTGLALSSAALPAGWSGFDNYSCTELGAGRTCTVALTYTPTKVESGTLDLGYVYINNAGQPRAPGGTVSIPFASTATGDEVLATATPAGRIDARTGSSATMTVSFVTDDGNAATGLAVTDDLGSLPDGWSGPAGGFSCPIVSTGSGCLLTLRLSPRVAAQGALALHYAYTDHAGMARTGVLDVPYATTAAGRVVAHVAPAGQVNAVEKTGAQSVAVSFATTDGSTASGLRVMSDLTALPPGFTGPGSFTCASVTGGAGCTLALTYAPKVQGRGEFTLYYGYTDATGGFDVGTLVVPYASTTDDTVAAGVAPAGPVAAIAKETSVPVTLSFATDDGRPATAIMITSGLDTLAAAGWTGPVTFSCAEAAAAGGCVLGLTYAPSAAGSGTLSLGYSYLNDAGQARTGTITIPYSATADDLVIGTATPSPVAFTLGGAAMPVNVQFATNDMLPASQLALTAGSLPAGWSSSAPTLACATVSAGAPCQIGLSYAPTVAASGTLTLNYTYVNDAGLAKSGSVLIPYSASP